jgi:putative sterol carrier protein/NAD(P)H-dependent FMN reductase
VKIVVLYSQLNDQVLENVIKIIYNTLHELEVEVECINLKGSIPFYEGVKVKQVTELILRLQQAEGIILATSVNMFAPTALMTAFLEHCGNRDYQAILNGKNYMTVTVANTLGEREASEYLYKAISVLGGFELGRLAIGARQGLAIGKDPALQEIIEKNVEDFYRSIRQNRKTFLSSEAYMYNQYDHTPLYNTPNIQHNSQIPVYEQPSMSRANFEQVQKPQAIQQPQSIEQPIYASDEQLKEDFAEIKSILDNIRGKASSIEQPQANKIEVYEAQFEAFAEKQQEDIKDITKMMSTDFAAGNMPMENKATYSRPQMKPKDDVVYRQKTCNQMMQSLPHHFQSHLAAGVSAVYQFNITGEEVFDGYLIIENGQTDYIDGTTDRADIYVYTTSDIMKDILRGKYSVQKAFMTGQLKVRGNFMLLSKLEQLYKKMS